MTSARPLRRARAARPTRPLPALLVAHLVALCLAASCGAPPRLSTRDEVFEGTTVVQEGSSGMRTLVAPVWTDSMKLDAQLQTVWRDGACHDFATVVHTDVGIADLRTASDQDGRPLALRRLGSTQVASRLIEERAAVLLPPGYLAARRGSDVPLRVYGRLKSFEIALPAWYVEGFLDRRARESFCPPDPTWVPGPVPGEAEGAEGGAEGAQGGDSPEGDSPPGDSPAGDSPEGR